jgi:cytochrome d ubiquinol oxidase subunit I
MDPAFLARIQFAITAGFHFIFPPLTIGLAWLIFGFMTKYRRTGQEIFLAHARFWTRLFAITFAVGVATGITLEFQFGTNWADYSRFVGDIFGAPLAAEGLLAFFLESTFVGVLFFGWKRFSAKTLWVASLLVAVGATLSALWILVANSWMQTPAGYEIVDGRAQLTSFWAAVFNPSTVPRTLHTIDSCLVAGAFLMMGVSAWYLWRGKHVAFARQSLKFSLVFGFITAAAELPLGHYHAVQVAETQPEKLAAFEGLFDTQREAPLLLFGFPDEETGEIRAGVVVPRALSMLVDFDPQTEVKGLRDFPRDEWPPVKPIFYTFHLMFVLGIYFIALTGVGLLLMWRGKLYDNKVFLALATFSMPLPVVAAELGWISAEVGRQPWIVYRVPGMRTAEAISSTVSAGEVVASLTMFGILYAILGVLWVVLLRREIRRGPTEFAARREEVPA